MKDVKMTRRESREAAFLIVFGLYVDNPGSDELLELVSEAGEPETDEFSRQLAAYTADNLERIDELISSSLVGWTIKRLPKASLAILRISAAQLLYMKEISDSIVINEAVELAKKYGADEDYSFVNGALRTISEAVKE